MRRRTFLLGGAAGIGGLVLGYRAWTDSFASQAAALVAGPGEALLAGWVKIATDDTVTVYVPHIDMGQGSQTALAMMLAEELDADWSKVRVAQAPGDKAFANRFLARGWILQGLAVPPLFDGAVDGVFAEAARFINLQVTGGSTAVRFTGQGGMRVVGAAGRAMLIEAAARRWRLPAGELRAADSVVSHPGSGRTARYGELAAAAAELDMPATPKLKPRESYRIIGTSVPRLDIPAKVTGGHAYGIDIRLPGLRYAAVKAAPVHGGMLGSVDPAPALAISGVEKVVPMAQAVAVVANGYWRALRGLAALSPRFTDGGNGTVSTEVIYAAQQRALETNAGEARHEAGNAAEALKSAPASRVVEATYRVPFLHHAAMEPINATAQFKDGKLTVWAGEQEPLPTRMALIRLSGLDAAKVAFVPMPVGGSFGRRAARTADHLAQMVQIARAMAPDPVQMIWSREEDFAQGAYRPQLTSRLRGALGADGRALAWSQAYIEGVPSQVTSHDIPYAIANQSIRAVASANHIRTGAWRSVNHTQHAFWSESFMDELAVAAGRDPFEFRRDHLAPGSRHRRVLETVAERAGWSSALPTGVGRGIALAEAYGSIVAEVVEASLRPDGRPRIHRVVAAVDCGDVCHPDTATQQVEGGIIMALGAAAAEQVTIAAGAVVQANFTDYPLATLADAPPRIEVHFLRSDAPWGGLGEPGVPPAVPALANALFAATGRRFRTLPIIAAART